MTRPVVITVPALMETPEAASACHVAYSSFGAYWRKFTSLREGSRRVGKKRLFLAKAVAFHIEKEMRRG